MTGICGIAGPAGTEIDALLSSMAVRGTLKRQTRSVATEGQAYSVGLCTDSDQDSIFETDGSTFAVDGAFFNGKSVQATLARTRPARIDELLLVPGAFSFLALQSGKIIAARDRLGQKPLYYGVDRGGRYAFASLKTALTRIGVGEPQRVPPGNLVAVSQGTLTSSDIHILRRPEPREVAECQATERLGDLLLDAVSRTVDEGSGLAFSGGLDSTLVAQAMKKKGLEPSLVSVGVGDQPELTHASQVAEHMGLDLTVRVISESEILGALPRVVETVETSDPTIVAIALPFYFACQECWGTGFDTVVAGQLSDELFGGYARFEEIAKSGGAEGIESEVWRSVVAASTNDFEPGDKIAVSSGLELRCPFAYTPLVEYSLRLPSDLKLRVSGGKVVRKYILRKLGEKWGLPKEVVNRPKKAVQYSSGVHKVLMTEAKRRGVTLSELLASA